MALLPLTAGAGESVYTLKFDDPQGVFFTPEMSGFRADGKVDVSEALQEALNSISRERGFGTLYLPEGKYRITRTIFIPSAIRLVGYGKSRPEIILADKASGFDGDPRPMLWLTGGLVTDPDNVPDGNPGTFYSGLSNVDLRIGKGNPGAVGVRAHVAQHGVVSHVTVRGGDGYACLYEVGNELEDVELYGARYGIDSGTSAPSWPIAVVDAYIEGAKEAAICSRNAGLAIVNLKVKNSPVGILCAQDMPDRLYLEDGFFENVRKGVVMTAAEGATNQLNLLEVHCKDVPVAVELPAQGKRFEAPARTYRIREAVAGLIIPQMGADADFGTVCEMLPETFPAGFSRTVPGWPDMSAWVSVKRYGAVGDGETDDTAAIQRAIDENTVVFFPEGWYRISGTLRMRPGSCLVGLHPFSTQLVLAESTPAFSGFGAPVPMVESSRGGDDIFTGIGISTGGYNKRAVGMKWTASERSLLNDVKFVGGHGSLRRPAPQTAGGVPAGPFGMGPFNRARFISSPSNPVAEQGPDRAWDNQYWSLWITDGGGGTFKDIWTASTYASAGLYVSHTHTPSRMYAVSLEHHMREESRWLDVENFKVYAMQYEEESREGRDDIAMILDGCRHLRFANTWFYRVVRVMTPRDYGTLTSGCSDIEFRNTRAWTQILCETAATAYDPAKRLSIYPLDFSLARITGTEASRLQEPASGQAVNIGDRYQFATGAVADSRGNVYFCEGNLRKIYRWDAASGALSLMADYPYRPLALAVDTRDNLIVITRYEGQPGFREETLQTIASLPDANSDYSGWGNGNWAVTAYAIDTRSGADTMSPLSLVPTESIRPERLIYPSHALRAGDFLELYDGHLPERSFLAPDGVTLIPYYFDLCRSIDLTAVTPGQAEPVYIAWENPKRTYRFRVNADGSLSATGDYLPYGEYATAYDRQGRAYVAAGQIYVLDGDGSEIGRLDLEERPISMAFGGREGEYLFITTNRSFYRWRIR